MGISKVAPQFRHECETPEGEELRQLIETHWHKMVEFSDRGEPALAAVLPHVPLRLAELLTRDSLMQAFGHMAHLEMMDRGLGEKGTRKGYDWPTIRSKSDLTTFHRTLSW